MMTDIDDTGIPADPSAGPESQNGTADQPEPSAEVINLFATAAAEADSRPVIKLGAELDQTRRDCDAALAEAEVFHNGTTLVHVVHDAIVDGPCVRELTIHALRSKLAAVARFETFNEKTKRWRPSKPPEDAAKALADSGGWRHVRPLRGIMEAPFLRRDCSVVTEPGYDAESGYQYIPSEDFGEIAAAPTQADAAKALLELAEVYVDFPFANEAARFVPVAALLTIMARPAIDGAVPGFAFDASTAGSGKTLQTDTVAFIATGRDASKMSLASDDVELEKVLGAYAVAGAQIVAFDNATTGSAIGGAPLDRVLSACNRVSLRILGRTEVPELPWRAIVTVSGNNLSFRGDTWRRMLVSRIEPQVDNPEERTNFRHPDLIGWVRQERARLVRAALTVLRAFVVAGRPRRVTRMGSFEAWSDLVPSAIVFAGGPNVLETRPKATEVTDEGAALATIVRRLGDLIPAGAIADGIKMADILHALYPVERLRGHQVPPDGFDDLREALETLVSPLPGKAPSAQKLGYRFRALKGRVINGKKLVPGSETGGVSRWKVVGTR